MKKLVFFCSLLLLISAFSAGSIEAQGKLGKVGKIFTKQEANVLFGKVIGTVKLSRKQVKAALANAKDYVLIKVKNSRAHIFSEKRASLLGNDKTQLAPDEVAFLCSKSVLEEFMSKTENENVEPVKGTKRYSVESSQSSSNGTITVEVRAEVLSLSSLNLTLEAIIPCPPVCPD